MKDHNKSKGQLIAELTELRQQVAKLQAEYSMANRARKDAQAALKESEQQIHTLAEALNVGLGMQNKDGLMTYANEKLSRLLGYSPDEIIGLPAANFLDEANRQLLAKQVTQKLKGRYDIRELAWTGKGGQKVSTLTSTAPIFDANDQLRGSMAVVTDDTGQKQVVQQLQSNEYEQRLLAETLGDIFLTLTAQLSPEAVLDEILRQVRRLVSYSAANIVLLKDNTLYLVRHQGYDTAPNHPARPKRDQALSDFPLDAQVIQTRQPLVITDTHQAPAWVTVSNLTWIRSFIAVPICLGQDVLGLLRLDSDRPGKFSSQDIQRMQPLANAAAIALNNARLYDQARRELADQVNEAETEIIQLNRKLLALQYTGAAIGSSSDLQHGLDTIAKEMANLLKVEGCAIFEWENNGTWVLARYGLERHWQEGVLAEFYPTADFPLIERILIERNPQQLTGSHLDNYPAGGADRQIAKLKTGLMVSMEFQDRVVGLVKLMDSRVERIFTNREIGLAQLLANLAASAIENTRLYDQVRQERNLLRTVIDNLPDYIFIKDVEGRFVMNNSTHIQALGAATQDELSGKTTFDTFPQDLADLYDGNDQKVLQSGQPLINHEEFTVDYIGRKKWLLTTKVPLRDNGGKVTGLVGISRDITKRRQAAEALWVSERKFRTLAEMTAAAILIFQQDQIRYANSAAEFITGYSRAELLQMNYWDLFHPDSNEVLISSGIINQLKEMPSPRYELKLLTKNGEERWVDNTLGVIEFEGKLAVLGTAFDITQHKQLEEALRRSAANLNAIFENTLQAFVLIDGQGTIQAFNKTASRGIEQIAGKKVRVGDRGSDYVPEADWEEFNTCFNKALKGGSVRLEKDIPLGNTSKWFEFNFNPVFAENDQVIGVCLSSINIDEHKRAAETLAASEERLLAEMQSVLIITRALVREIDLNNLLEFIIAQAEHLTAARGAIVMLLSEDHQQLRVAAPGDAWQKVKAGSQIPLQGSIAEVAIARQQVQISHLAQQDELVASIRALLHPVEVRSLLCAPLVVQSEDLGVLVIWSEKEQGLTMHDARLIDLFADQAALALHNAHLHAHNRKLAIEKERHRLARELHDSVTQSLYSMGLAAQSSLKLLGENAEKSVREPIEHIHTLSKSALAEMREHLYHLNPTALTDQGLIEALLQHCDALSKVYALKIEISSIPEPSLSARQQEALYYIVREALWNVIKHAHAFHVKVTITEEHREVVLSVEDDGIGFIPSQTSRDYQSLGLTNIKDRTNLINAALEIHSEPGQGTKIMVRVPVDP